MESSQNVNLLQKEGGGSSSDAFKTRRLDRILAEQIDKAFHKQTAQVCLENLAKIAAEHSPIDLANAVSMLPLSLRPILFENFTSITRKIEFILNTDSSTRIAVFRYISDFETKKLLEEMSSQDAVFLLDDMSEKRYRRILELLDQEKIDSIKEHKQHSRNSAGRLMSNEYFSFNGEMTVAEVAEIIKENPGIEFTRILFVIDFDQKLLGFVTARHLIVNPPHVKLKEVTRPVCNTVTPEASREEVVDVMQRYKIAALPVVDESHKILGAIGYDDVMEAMDDIADETMACMAGTGENVREPESVIRRFFYRAPWLVVTLLAGLLNMSVMSVFQEYEGIFLTFVFFFVPLITGMSGNIGLQCSTILVRNMALGLLTQATKKEVIRSEICLGFLNGAVFGVLSGFFVFCLNIQGITIMTASPAAVGIIVGVGLFGACITGTLLGVFSPLVFSRFGVDPAVASGPIVTAFNDFLSMTIYFMIAILLSNVFMI
ncbi:magnesium transporter [Candidatus Aerophobetes bacterium]|uniref:Magnesium transporter n=1 Tax=Aerophobetes bacterium TaxID=2030807 RepID=A0A2A4YMI1_UNCAE|nr:MAG: magnesium transporter [Candidatus Aerophobetes bacterium]